MRKSANRGKKIKCPKCGAVYYDFGKKSAPCPNCREKNLIPSGTIAKVRLAIKRGGYNDPAQGWTMGIATKTSNGAIYLNCHFQVVGKQHSNKEFTSLIGLFTPKGPWWGNEGRKTLRNILNSAHGISDKDYSSSALRNRFLTSLEALEGVEFLAEIDQKKGSDGIKRNELKRPVTLDDPEYHDFLSPAKTREDTSQAKTKKGKDPHDFVIGDPQFQPIWLNKV